MTASLAEKKPGLLAWDSAKDVLSLSSGKDVLLFGPGIARDESVPAILEEILAQWDKPAVIDAGGLWALAQKKDIAAVAAGPLILTPHPGELALLLGCDVADIQGDRPAAARRAAKEYGAVVVLKGASSIVTDHTGALYINSTGNPIMATAGSGDVLAGALSAFIAQGLPPLEAAVLAVYIHGRAGDLLAEKLGVRGGLAGELAAYLPIAIKELRTWRA